MTADAVAHLRDDQTTRWRRGDRVPAEDYLQTHPGLSDEDRLVLVAGELALRWERGERPTAEEYAGRFPAFAADLQMQFELRSLVGDDDPFGPTPTGPQVATTPERPTVPGYDLHEEIGRGGWGVVYRATHTRLGRAVALKVIRGGAAADPALAVRFLDEARVLAKLDHPHVLRVFEVGQAGGGVFLSLELAEAGSLAELLQSGPLPPRDAANLLASVASAAAAAHARGIVHRDVKPSNVLLVGVRGEGLGVSENPSRSSSSGRGSELTPNPSPLTPKLADFGLAKQLDLGPGLTATGQVLGTPRYMAPEQASGEGRVGPPADVYALGAVLYECLTGRPPLLGAGTLALLRQVQEQEPVSPRALNPAVPVDLATVTMKCLEKEPGRRYPSAAELEQDLRRFLADEPVTARPVGAAERAWRWARRHPREAGWMGLAAGLLLALAGGAMGTVVLLKRQKDEAVASERDAELARLDAERLLATRLREAGLLGQRTAGLDAVRKRWEATPPAGRTPALRLALRSEAAACLTATDVERVGEWPVGATGLLEVDFLPDQPDRYAYTDPATGDTMVAGDPPVRVGPKAGDYRLRRFSPDGRTLIEGCFVVGQHRLSRLRGWDWRAGRPLFDRPLSMSWLTIAFIPPDHRLLAWDGDASRFVVLDRESGAEVGRSPVRFRMRTFAVHPNGRWVAVAENFRAATVVDLADGWREVARVPLGEAEGLAWSPDGRTLAAILFDGQVAVWDSVTGRTRVAPWPHRVGECGVEFAGPDTLATTAANWTTQLWDAASLRPQVRLPGRLARVTADGRQFVTTDDRRLVRYRRVSAGEYRELATPATAASPSPDGAVVVTSEAGGPSVWAADTLRRLAGFGLDDCGPVAFDPAGGRLATLGTFSKVHVWPVAAGPDGQWTIGPPAPAPMVPAHDPFLSPQHMGRSVAWAAGRLLVADNRDGRLEVLDPAGGGPPRLLTEQTSPTVITGTPDGRYAAAAATIHRRLVVVSTADGRVVLDRPGFATVAVSPDGRWLAAGGHPGLAVWRVGEWDRPAWEAGPDVVTDAAAVSLAVRPDGRVLAAPVARDRIGLFDTATGDRLLDLAVPSAGEVCHLAFAPDGGRLYVTRYEESVGVWDLRAVAARLAELGLDLPADELPPPAPAPAVTAVTVDRRRKVGGDWPPEFWSQQWMYMAVGERWKKKWADAIHNDSLALAAYPLGPAHDVGRAAVLAIRGGDHLSNGSPLDAQADWREAVRLDPGRADVAAKLAVLLLAAGDRGGAAAALLAVPAANRTADWRQAMARTDVTGGLAAAAAGGPAGW